MGTHTALSAGLAGLVPVAFLFLLPALPTAQAYKGWLDALQGTGDISFRSKKLLTILPKIPDS